MNFLKGVESTLMYGNHITKIFRVLIDMLLTVIHITVFVGALVVYYAAGHVRAERED